MTLLALKYRPQRFAELCGQDSARLILQAILYGGDIPPAFIFDGTRGSGKTSAARIVAATLNCFNPQNGDNCGVCESCVEVAAGTSLSVHEIDAASNGGIEDIRELKELVQFSTGSKYRVILLDEAHGMSKPAFNALLKVLEEPPANTLFILLTTEPERILETVKSRSMTIHFNPVSPDAIYSRLFKICTEENFGFKQEALLEISQNSGGGLRDAVMLLEQAFYVDAFDLASIRKLMGKTDHPSKIVQAVVLQDYEKMMAEVESYFMSSGDVSRLITELIAEFQNRFYNNSISATQLVGAVKILWDGRSISSVASRTSRIQLEALTTLLYGLFYTKPTQPILKVDSSKDSDEEELSLDELTAIVEG